MGLLPVFRKEGPKQGSVVTSKWEAGGSMKEETGIFFRGAVTGVLAAVVLGCGGYYAVYGELPFFSDSVMTGNTAAKAVYIENLIEEEYLEEVDEEKIADGMYAGMVSGLGDRYSGYYTADQYQEVLKSIEGRYQGIGLAMRKNTDTGEVTVEEVYEDSPAMEAGIQEGDQLYQLDGENVSDMELEEISQRLQNGEEATLTLLREGEEEPVQVTVAAGEVEVPVVSARMLENQMGYLKIDEFTDGTSEQFASAFQTLQEDGMEGLIIDLRNNPGGLLDAVCDTLEQILPKGLIVYTEDKNGNRVEHSGDGETPIQIPLVLLINENSASAAEIFAGAVKDYEVGTLVGATTYGKGIVQQTYQLRDGSAVKLTIAKYYTPNGVNIHGTGIQPDITVEWPQDQEALASDFDFSQVPQEEWLAQDPQMEKAVELLADNMI